MRDDAAPAKDLSPERDPVGRLGRYGIALVAVALTVLARWILEPVVNDRPLLLIFVPAVLVASESVAWGRA